MRKKQWLLVMSLCVSAVIIYLDQLTKQLVVEYFASTWSQSEIPVTSWFNICLVYNRGISFGIFNGAVVDGSIILASLATVVAFGFLIWVIKDPKLVRGIYTGFIAGGALGNAIDRVYIGAVIDFIDLHVLKYHWPAFNIADSFICIGTAIAVFHMFLQK